MPQWKKFFGRWFAFLTITLDPATAVLISLALSLMIVLLQQNAVKDSLLVTALTLMISALSGFVGAIWYDKWNTLTGERILAARGKAAVRSLKLLLTNVLSLHKRTSQYLNRFNDDEYKKGVNDEVIRTYLEEILRNCVALQEETINSIENWIDIVPEADVRSQIGIVTELREQYTIQSKRVEELVTQVKQAQDQSQDQQKLKHQLSEAETELTRLQKELAEKRSTLFSTGLTASPISASGFYPSMLTGISGPLFLGGHQALTPDSRLCPYCGQVYSSTYDILSGQKVHKCPNCGRSL